jgi:hypothetical protein
MPTQSLRAVGGQPSAASGAVLGNIRHAGFLGGYKGKRAGKFPKTVRATSITHKTVMKQNNSKLSKNYPS